MKRFLALFLTVVLLLSLLASCKKGGSAGDGQTATEPTPGDESTGELVDSSQTDIPEDLKSGVNTLVVTCLEGTDACWAFSGKKLTFSKLKADTVVTLSGDFDGQILIDAGDDYKFELSLMGVKLYSSENNPIEIVSGDKVTVSAKKDTQNFVYDTRAALSSDSAAHSAALYAACDLNLEGKGSLTVISASNNGIHTKDDLSIKNLTLSVTSTGVALKGNDSVSMESGVVTLISKSGDGIKTSNTDISSKQKQRGKVAVSGGELTVYAACDGIDAAYNAEISDWADVKIYTDRYSAYSSAVETAESGDVRYIRFTAKTYNYSVKYYNSDSDYKWVNATYSKSVSAGRDTYYYYSFEKLTGYDTVQIFFYSSGQAQGQDSTYATKTDFITWNNSYDTFAIESRMGSLSANWTNYSSSAGNPGGPGGFGGMQEGNSEKGDHSTKGIKADNEILISGGTVFVKSYDDALHVSAGNTLENGSTSTGNLTVSGGALTVFSKDDGLHADGNVTVSGGSVSVTGSYEGVEGSVVTVSGGTLSVISSDDGINSTATSGDGIIFSGGSVYIYAGGDGIDANSKTSYRGILFAGGDIRVVSTSSNNSSIDTEQGYTYTGGTVLAVCPSGGMGSESSKCQNFSSIGTKTTQSLKSGQTLSVSVSGSVTSSLTMPCNLSALIIYLGSPNAGISVK